MGRWGKRGGREQDSERGWALQSEAAHQENELDSVRWKSKLRGLREDSCMQQETRARGQKGCLTSLVGRALAHIRGGQAARKVERDRAPRGRLKKNLPGRGESGSSAAEHSKRMSSSP
eukprot:574755-Pleurochrysis_carterae.AAC.1